MTWWNSHGGTGAQEGVAGYYGDPTRECRCTPAIIQRYLGKIIAELDASESVSAKHLAEAVQYRSLDRSYWS